MSLSQLCEKVISRNVYTNYVSHHVMSIHIHIYHMQLISAINTEISHNCMCSIWSSLFYLCMTLYYIDWASVYNRVVYVTGNIIQWCIIIFCLSVQILYIWSYLLLQCNELYLYFILKNIYFYILYLVPLLLSEIYNLMCIVQIF